MIEFSAEKFDTWQQNFDIFEYDFKKYCFLLFRAYKVHADFVPKVLSQIHSQWVENVEHWLQTETSPNTVRLSHLKRAALLLNALVSLEYLTNFVEHEYDEEEKVTFRGTAAQYTESRQDLIDAREAVISLDFVLNIIDYFEKNRIDREEEYTVRLTFDMRHDLIGYLLSGHAEEKALYLILKALYLRRSGRGSAN